MASVVCLPEELSVKPLPLIALVGLNTTENRGHTAIWNIFTSRDTNDRVALKFENFTLEHNYPVPKQKRDPSQPTRASYDWYIPKGLLKTGWMRKHLREMPAVCVLFYDLDLEDPAWRDKMLDVSSQLECIRRNLQGRNTKITVVLLQKRPPPPGEDHTAWERASVICQQCGLLSKCLFCIPHADSQTLAGYVYRLEKVIFDLASSYYSHEIKKVKSHRECLNKTTHQLLFVRHQFKLGFFNELKQDSAMALKHYKQAYTNLQELRMHDSHLLELKTVAGFINYKICRLSFNANPSEAISHFRKHIDCFKNLVGVLPLAFEHEAWLSRQFELMGDIFSDTIRSSGLAAIMTQHPGVYYEEAALHAVRRRTLANTALQQSLSAPDETQSGSGGGGDPLEMLEQLDFYGQRPWRQGNQSIEPADIQKEREAIRALLMLESKVQYSKIIIPLLTSAVNHFKRYKGKRMKQYPLVLIAEEYIHDGNFASALKCFERVLGDFRRERWWHILSRLFANALKCAFMEASVVQYIAFALELVNTNSLELLEEKHRLAKQLNALFLRGEIPNPPSEWFSSSAASTTTSRTLATEEHCMALWSKTWDDFLSRTNKPHFNPEHLVLMNERLAAIECKVAFDNVQVPVDSPLVLSVYLKLNGAVALPLNELRIHFDQQAYNRHGVWVFSEQSGVSLEPNVVKQFTLRMPALESEHDKVIRVNAVYALLGSSSRAGHVWLCWAFSSEPLYHSEKSLTEPASTSNNSAQDVSAARSGKVDSWLGLLNLPVVALIPRTPLAEVQLHHEPPPLVNEFYPVLVKIINKESVSMENLRLSVWLKEELEESLGSLTHVAVGKAEAFDAPVCRANNVHLLDSLDPGKEHEATVFTVCLQKVETQFFLELVYTTHVIVEGQRLACVNHKRVHLALTFTQAFDVNITANSDRLLPISEVVIEEPFILQVTTCNVSPWPVEIHHSKFLLGEYIHDLCPSQTSQIAQVHLDSLEGASECRKLQVAECALNNLHLGAYLITWRRRQMCESGPLLPLVSTQVSLPRYPLLPVPLGIRVEMASCGILREPLDMSFVMHNRSPLPHEVEATADTCDGFLFSSARLVRFRVLPQCEHRLTFRLYPLMSGPVELPRVHFRIIKNGIVTTGGQQVMSSSPPVSVPSSSVTPTSSGVLTVSVVPPVVGGLADAALEENMTRSLPTYMFIKPCGLSQ